MKVTFATVYDMFDYLQIPLGSQRASMIARKYDDNGAHLRILGGAQVHHYEHGKTMNLCKGSSCQISDLTRRPAQVKEVKCKYVSVERSTWDSENACFGQGCMHDTFNSGFTTACRDELSGFTFKWVVRRQKIREQDEGLRHGCLFVEIPCATFGTGLLGDLLDTCIDEQNIVEHFDNLDGYRNEE